jgi:hypothetical protein
LWQEIGGATIRIADAIEALYPDAVSVTAVALTNDNRVIGDFKDEGSPGEPLINFIWTRDENVGDVKVVAQPLDGLNDINWGGSLGSFGSTYYNGSQFLDVNTQLHAASSDWTIERIHDINNQQEILAAGRLDGGPLTTLLLTMQGPPSEFVWNEPGGGDFSVGGNWDPEGVPGLGATAIIDLPGSYHIALSEDVEIGQFKVGASANPTLALVGRRMDAPQIIVDQTSHLNLNGVVFGSHITTDLINVGPNAELTGDAWVRPRTGGTLEVNSEGTLSPGQAGQAAPEHTLFTNTDGGPEPSEFYAHMAIRGDLNLSETSTTNVVLIEQKAINQGRDFGVGSPPPLPSTEVLVTGGAALDGTLNVSLADGYEPRHGDSFSIIKGQVASTFSPDNINMPVVPDNGLELVPIQTQTGIHAVVPQKVRLVWDQMPVGVVSQQVLGEWVTTIDTSFQTDPYASTVALEDAAAFETFKTKVMEFVKEQFTAVHGSDPLFPGVQGLVFEEGPIDLDAINVYFIDPSEAPSLRGLAFNGIDRFNIHQLDQAFVTVRGFDPASPEDVERTAETVTHEIGHMLGLRHINPPGVTPVMDYDASPGVTERFSTGAFLITEPPEPGGHIFDMFHNPAYHLLRYVDGVPHKDLVALGIEPGQWDDPLEEINDVIISFAADAIAAQSLTLAAGKETTLFDVQVVKAFGAPDEIEVLAHFDQITLAELANHSFRITELEGIGIFAASTLGGEWDIALAPGDPFTSPGLALYPGAGPVQGFLQMEADNPQGYETLAALTLDVIRVPEPATGLMLLIGMATMLTGSRMLVSKLVRP